MVDKEIIEYTISEIKKKRGTPYHMVNEELADELYPYIQNIFADVQMIKCGITQWFIVSARAKNKLKKQLDEMILNHKKAIVELECAINRLN